MGDIGKLFIVWIFIFLGIILGVQYGYGDLLNPNQTVVSTREGSIISVSLRGDGHGHYRAHGQINGAPVRFMLDTGATDVAIPEKVAEKLGLTRGGSFLVSTANGDVSVYDTTLDSVSIGDIVVNNVSGSITPTLEGNEVLLGMSFLRHLDFAQRGGNELILSTR